MNRPKLTVDEALAVLKRSGLPTVVTEDSEDYRFLRRIEEILSRQGVSLLPLNGKQDVLRLFERRAELARNDVAFLVDSDLWAFTGRPLEFNHRKLFSTDGYSIENDLYRDGELEKLLYEDELEKYQNEINITSELHSHCVRTAIMGGASHLAHHPGKFLDTDGNLNPAFIIQIGYEKRDEELYNIIRQDYAKYLRGKTLLQLLMRRLSAQGRAVKIGRAQLMEFASFRLGPNLRRIAEDIEAFFILAKT